MFHYEGLGHYDVTFIFRSIKSKWAFEILFDFPNLKRCLTYLAEAE